MEITWEARKARINRRKHGIDFTAAASALADPQAIAFEDKCHTEQRFVAIGYDALDRLLRTVYTYRDADTVRLISARRATPRDRKRYEQR